MKAKIYWKSPSDGGRSKLPVGVGSPPYATIVRFEGSNEPWPPKDAWTLVVEKIKEEEPFIWIAEVSFLSSEAPRENLNGSRKFELYEGNKCVALGEPI